MDKLTLTSEEIVIDLFGLSLDTYSEEELRAFEEISQATVKKAEKVYRESITQIPGGDTILKTLNKYGILCIYNKER